MPKAKIGISLGLLCAAVYFAALFGGYVPLTLVAGYILLFEENTWLRQSAMKAFAIVVLFDIVGLFIGFLPEALHIANRVAALFGAGFTYAMVEDLLAIVTGVLWVAKKLVLVVLGLKALRLGTMAFAPVDTTLQKHI